eukprot:m.1342638 g.1342638  ORF g.1342638 m.1342638 type:complete len:58 (+) comp24899_c0_seq1:5009-5182(+)
MCVCVCVYVSVCLSEKTSNLVVRLLVRAMLVAVAPIADRSPVHLVTSTGGLLDPGPY